MLVLAALLSCGSVSDPEEAGARTSGTATVPEASPTTPRASEPVPLAILDAPPAVDPLRDVPFGYTVQADPGEEVTLALTDPEGNLLFEASVTADADGRYAGEWLPATEQATVGAHVLTATAADGRADTHVVHLVRPGFVEVMADDDPGSSRVPLYWRVGDWLQDPSMAFSALPALEGPEGTPLDFPPVSGELVVADQVEGTQPLAYAWDGQPVLTLSVGSSSVLGGTGLHGVDVRAVVPGWTVVGSEVLAPGQPIVIQRDAPLGSTLGISEETLDLQFVVHDDHGQVWRLGAQALPLKIYRLLGPPTFRRQSRLYYPWVVAVEDALAALEGVAPEHGAVANAVVDWVYNDLGLVYDTQYGASAYSTYYEGWSFSWDSPHFSFSDFLVRRFGNVINCSDAGNIVTTYANMLGAELHHLIILEDFGLNEISAIGIPTFTSCPFGPMGCGFSYHAVTSHDGGATIWDATLALDGDPDPGAGPWNDLQVEGIPGDEYLWRLVRSGTAAYAYESSGAIQ